MTDRLILMGVIGKPHGVRGLVRVNSFAAEAESLEAYPLMDRTGRRFALAWLHDNVAQLSEVTPQGHRRITDRTEAETLTNLELFAPRSALPEPDDEEFYLADLIGLKAKSETGAELGTIAAVHDYGGGSSLEIMPGSLLVPFTRAAVPVVDFSSGHVVIVPPTEVTVSP
ncbi:MAG TPA: ribosome maturation factor RimM [Acidocella sp.]|nr:ribosome maturation factor RimM [Acidocella sp.]